MTFEDVAALALPLPGVAIGTSYGTPAVKVGDKLLARLRDANDLGGDMVLKVEDGLREALIETQPDVFHTTPHYDGYPMLLVRLDGADPGQIAGLVERAWGQMASAKLRRERV